MALSNPSKRLTVIVPSDVDIEDVKYRIEQMLALRFTSDYEVVIDD